MVEAPEVAAPDFLRISIADGEPEKAIGELLEHAAKFGFSDIFLTTNENHVAVLVRHLGILRHVSMLSLDMGRRCISSIKARAGMDVAERRRPQDGRWLHQSGGPVIDLRLNAIPTLYGEDLSLRLLIRNTQLLEIEALGLHTNDFNSLLGLLNSPSGLILVTGPTGAGKTTTLYACLNYLNNGTRKIHTIEDPIEYTLPGVRQSQVHSNIDVGFAELLRNVLRQAPDVIMIGEIRDPQTAEIAVRGANSGHLVLATMHAPVAVGAIQTMLNLGVSPAFLASSLHGVVAQRLVRTLCPSCKTVFDVGGVTTLFDSVRHWLGPSEGNVIHGPGKCDACCQSGYQGRTGVFELLVVDREMRRRISEQRPVHELQEQAIANGLVQCRQTALLKVARGETSIEEVMRAIPAEHLGLEE
jgi:type II secretory ATPase GspE/PulE/Tfp pilus assembly ATPase PilB-like protein